MSSSKECRKRESQLIQYFREGWLLQLYEGDLLSQDKNYTVTIISPKGVAGHGKVGEINPLGLKKALDMNKEFKDFSGLVSILRETPYARASQLLNLYNTPKIR